MSRKHNVAAGPVQPAIGPQKDCAPPPGDYDCAVLMAYDQLLSATICHVEELKQRGVRFIPRSHNVLVVAPLDDSSEPAPTPAAVISPLDALRATTLACTKCPHLVSSRRTVVFGIGNPRAELMFVGEAPGADEDEAGEPFVGKAGQLLTRIIQAMGFSRETVYISNILKCRPDTPGQSTGNRKPTPEEMNTCKPYLLQQIELIQPRVIVALGATALHGLLGIEGGITKLRGQWQQFQGIPLMPTFHPAFLLRNQSNTEKRKVWEDMLQVMEKLGVPISDKQRNFFQRA